MTESSSSVGTDATEGYNASDDQMQFPRPRGKQGMNKQQLLILKEGVENAISERRSVGEYNADSKHMLFLLSNMLALIDHAISQVRPERK